MRLGEPACRCAGSGALMPCKVIIEDDAIIIGICSIFGTRRGKSSAPGMLKKGGSVFNFSLLIPLAFVLHFISYPDFSSHFFFSFFLRRPSRGVCNTPGLEVFVPHSLWSSASATFSSAPFSKLQDLNCFGGPKIDFRSMEPFCGPKMDGLQVLRVPNFIP